MKYLATSFGSAGDFLPTLAIAKTLREGGHEVLFVTNPFHEAAIRRAGVDFLAAGTFVDVFKELESKPIYLDTIRGPKALWEDLSKPYVTSTYRVVKEAIPSFKPDVVIASNLSHGVFWASLEAKVRSVMIGATPVGWMTGRAPMQFTDVRIPELLLPFACGLTSWTLRHLVGSMLQGLARELGSALADPTMSGIEEAVVLHLGTWSRHVRPPSPSDRPNTRTCGFVRAGQLGGRMEVSAEVEAFLDAGEPPVVVGLGSAYSVIGGDILEELAAACAELGRRCLIVGHPPTKGTFSGDTLAVPYAPYHLVFPRALAVVVHGGAGTTGEAMRAGRPIVSVPFAYDQFGLSWCVELAGAGVRVSKSRRSRAHLVRAVDRVIGDESIRAGAARAAALLAEEPDGAVTAAASILALGPA